MKSAIEKYHDAIMDNVMSYAAVIGVPEQLHIEYLVSACLANPSLALDLNAEGKDSLSPEACIEIWVDRFKNAFDSRLSALHSNSPAVISFEKAKTDFFDKMIRDMKVSDVVNPEDFAEKLSLNADCRKAQRKWIAENRKLTEMCLKEFLAEKLLPAGWVMAWGNVLQHVDFCDKDGHLLQVRYDDWRADPSVASFRADNKIRLWVRYPGAHSKCSASGWRGLSRIAGRDIPNFSDLDFEAFSCSILKSRTSVPV